MGSKTNNLVFGLDIGTRSIVGTVGIKLSENSFIVEAMCSKEHDTRAMLDGQIHDIYKVTQTVLEVKQELERATGQKLESVCIAAAGRVLMTQTVETQIEYASDHVVTDEDVYSLDLNGVEEAYVQLGNQLGNTDVRFYCVGYSAVKYYLNGYSIAKLQGHHAQKIGVKLLATFLPEEVIEGLYTAVEGAGLRVENLTLEPIAAINVAIPEKFRMLNIALVDVGAGTSDICITNDGAVMAYGMIPYAGDELTEILAKKYLIEFNEAERIKVESTKKKTVSFTDVMGIKTKLDSEQIQEDLKEEYQIITKNIADKIIELNGGKSVSAVFVVGGGGKYPGFVESLAKYLDLPLQRVALRGEEVLSNIMFRQSGIKKDSLIVTPIGICMNYYENNNTFVNVKANGANIKVFDNSNITVADVAMQMGIKNEELFPMLGENLKFTVNGEEKVIRGRAGEPAIIKLNGEVAAITTQIKDKDILDIVPSTKGTDAIAKLSDLSEYKESVRVYLNDVQMMIPIFATVNGQNQSADYEINENDEIEIDTQITLADIIMCAELDKEGIYEIDGEQIDEDTIINEDDRIVCKQEEEVVEMDFSYEEEQDLEPSYKSSLDKDFVSNTASTTIATNGTTDITRDNALAAATSKDATVSGAKAPSTAAKDNSKPAGNMIFITVNGNVVKLYGKQSYIFVDILDFFDFDTNVLGGSKLMIKVNGVISQFTTPIKDGDNTEIYWEK